MKTTLLSLSVLLALVSGCGGVGPASPSGGACQDSAVISGQPLRFSSKDFDPNIQTIFLNDRPVDSDSVAFDKKTGGVVIDADVSAGHYVVRLGAGSEFKDICDVDVSPKPPSPGSGDGGSGGDQGTEDVPVDPGTSAPKKPIATKVPLPIAEKAPSFEPAIEPTMDYNIPNPTDELPRIEDIYIDVQPDRPVFRLEYKYYHAKETPFFTGDAHCTVTTNSPIYSEPGSGQWIGECTLANSNVTQLNINASKMSGGVAVTEKFEILFFEPVVTFSPSGLKKDKDSDEVVCEYGDTCNQDGYITFTGGVTVPTQVYHIVDGSPVPMHDAPTNVPWVKSIRIGSMGSDGTCELKSSPINNIAKLRDPFKIVNGMATWSDITLEHTDQCNKYRIRVTTLDGQQMVIEYGWTYGTED